jgi:hypothetical protein
MPKVFIYLKLVLFFSLILLLSVSANAQSCTANAGPPFTGGGNLWGSSSAQVIQYFTQKVDIQNGFACNLTLNNPVISSPNFIGSLPSLTVAGLITPNSTVGIAGTTTNDNAQAGSIGEYTTNNTSSVSVTSATPFNATSVSLTAGDWDVTGCIYFDPAVSTTWTNPIVAINTTTATLPALPGFNVSFIKIAFTAGQTAEICSPLARESLAATSTIYLIGQATIAVSSMTANGYIRARRVR